MNFGDQQLVMVHESWTVSRKFQGSISWVFSRKKLPEMWRFRVRFITLKWFRVLNIFPCDSSNIIPPLFHIFRKIGSLRSLVLKWSTQNSSKVLSGRHFLHPFLHTWGLRVILLPKDLIFDLFMLWIYNVLDLTKAWFGSKRLKKGWIRLKIRL